MNPAVAEFPRVSRTVALKVAVPAVVGVPAIAPFDARVRPAGSDPPTSVQVYCPLPPVADRVCEYAVPAVPGDSCEGVATVSGLSAATMVMENCCGALVCRESLAWRENAYVPAAVGVP